MPGSLTTPDAQYAALAQRVTGLEGQLSAMQTHNDQQFMAISSQIKGISDAFAAKSQTPWGTLISAMGVLIVIIGYGGNLALAPVLQKISDHEDDISSLRAGIVSRGEHERVWANADARYIEINRRLDEMRADFAGVYGIKDVIRQIQDEQKTIKQEIYAK